MKKISYFLHNDKNNKKIFNILNSESKYFYYHTNFINPKTILELNRYIKKKGWIFDIFYNNQLVGLIEINPKTSYLNYWVASKFQNLGIMSKILKETEKEFIKLGHKKIFAHIKKDNIASIKAIQKNNFKLKEERVFKDDDIMLLFEKKLI